VKSYNPLITAVFIYLIIPTVLFPLPAYGSEIIGWGDPVIGVDLSGGFVAITAGERHSLGLKSDGSIVCWGNNWAGQCNVPLPNTSFVAITAGGEGDAGYNLGLKANGSIVAWGDNNYGKCNIPLPNTGFLAIAAGIYHSLGLKSDGSIVCWGYNAQGQCNVPSPNTGFVAIAAGAYHSLGLKSDGSIVCWGYNAQGQCNVPSPNTGFVAIAVGAAHSLGLKSNGSIVAWGDNSYGLRNVPSPNTGFVAIEAGWDHSLGLKADGSVVAWGDNYYGQCNVPFPNTGFIAIAAGGEQNQYQFGGYSLGLKADGSIVCWGNNYRGQCNGPSLNNGFVAITTYGHHSLGLKSDGSIVSLIIDSSGANNIPLPNTGFIAIATGSYHSLGLKANGSIVCWGDNGQGQCNVPEPNTGFVTIAAGERHSLGLKANGSIVAWGDNYYGQRSVPLPNGDFMAIAAGYYHSLGLKTDGSIVCWGSNYYGQCDVPLPNTDFVAIAAGQRYSLGLKTDGSIIAWGSINSVPFPNTDFVAIAAGTAHSLGLKADGSIVGWGWNTYGQCIIPEPNKDFVAITAGYVHSLALQGGELPLAFKIRSILPTHAGNLGPALIDIIGSGFKQGTTVKLIKGPMQLEPNEVNLVSIFKLKTKFDLTSIPAGKYDIVVTKPNGNSVTLPQSFEIMEGGQPHLWTRLTVPPQVRPGRSYTAYIEYGNDGDVAMTPPILHISNSTGVRMQIGDDGRVSNTGLPLLGLSDEGDITTLLPGSRGTIPIKFTAPQDGMAEFQLKAYQPDDTPFDWGSLEASLRLPDVDPVEWDADWAEKIANTGNTWRQVQSVALSYLLTLQEQTTYRLKAQWDFLGIVQRSLITWTSMGCTGGQFDAANDVTVNYLNGFNANRPTYIVTHGWNSSSNNPEVNALAQALVGCSTVNVVTIDWEKGACTGINAGQSAKNAIAAGKVAREKLKGVDFSNVTWVGHSHGNEVNREASQGEGSAIILDNANRIVGGNPQFAGIYKGGALALTSDSLADNGPCTLGIQIRTGDRSYHLPSGLDADAHGKGLRWLKDLIHPSDNPLDPSDCGKINTLRNDAFSHPEAPAGWYDGNLNDQGQITFGPHAACLTAVLNIPGSTVAQGRTQVIRPRDPSEKRGTIGYDPNGTPDELCRHFVHPGEPLEYTVYFENEPNATAPAQEVRVVDYLSPSLNWATIELGEIVFGDQVVTSLAGKVSGQVTVPLADSNDVVDVNVQFNVYTGRITWDLRTIDPNTGEFPEDPLAGFLPPNDPNHRGEGHVSFTIYPQEELLDAHIDNRATIFFDTEAPFDVNVWSNSVDGLPPVSAVSPLPAVTTPTSFKVCWSGDDGQGSGIAGYDIYVAANDEPNVPWILNTRETSAVFAGVPGYMYRFYSIARDFMGNFESAPAVPDAETTLGPIDFQFYALLAKHWLDINCNLNNIWCEGADLNTSGQVDIVDLSILAENWLEGT
jgi:alpha-tubulin suppressor-like RCC1 family protein